MQLVDIAEPEIVKSHDAVYGIDLGTTNSLVAKAEKDGSVLVFEDASGSVLIPSIVGYSGGIPVAVGKRNVEAVTISSVKRLMGKGIGGVPRKFCGVPLVERDGGVALEIEKGLIVSPVEVSAEILRCLSKMVQEATGEPIAHAVVTVPAYFDEVARRETRNAAELAGIEVLRLLNEPTAALVAYEQISDGEICIVYDFGGGTFDVSVVKMHEGALQIIATAGDTSLGGDDIDFLLAKLVLQKYSGEQVRDEEVVPVDLLYDAKRTKELICKAGCEGKYDFKVGNGATFSCVIDSNEFGGLVECIVRRTVAILESAMLDAKVTVHDVSKVVLVGGSSRLPQVKESLKQMFGDKIYDDVDPERAVVIGAALQAYYLSDPASAPKSRVLIDVVPLSLSVETMGGIAEVIIPRNTPVPAVVAQEFTTYVDGQTMISIHVCQGEREIVVENRSLAKFDLQVPPLPAGAARVRVEFRVDMDGLLTVSAKDVLTGLEKNLEINSLRGVTQANIEQAVIDSVENFDSDMVLKELSKAKAEGDKVLEVLDVLIAGAEELLPDSELKEVLDAASSLKAALAESADVDEIHELVEKASLGVIRLKKKKNSVF
ncbi:chaperone protein HscA [Anaplasma platys]|uniref:Chaperone protein HscA n=1 Tax=Anaplasma platys TaxID=949 RepID=A0A858PYD8_9RICK|nr:Hsp70 family protein [Anaplasma platys]QJC27580.1 chaperone protein HscA [Anaplasma platys]